MLPCCFAQKEAFNWHFGIRAHLNFDSGTAVPLYNSNLLGYEGTASISDPATGQLLMYSDGRTIWDRNQNPMPGTLTTPLNGNSSSTMGTIIVPKPGSNHIYYVFTVPAELDAWWGATNISMNYSVVDLNLNGGNGDVITWNVPLMDSSTEKLAVTSNCDRSVYWIVAHKWLCDSFYAYKLTAAGLSEPVKSAVGLVHQGLPWDIVFTTCAGYMKFSPNGRKIGLVVPASRNAMELFDFDFSTGVISNPITEQFPFAYYGLYGCSFSPDNSKFYITWNNLTQGSLIYQYNIAAGSQSAILASKTIVASEPEGTILRSLLNGPDGKMYVVKEDSTRLGVINHPNALGLASNYETSGIDLGPDTARIGLPNFVESFLSGNAPLPSFLIPETLTICKGDTIFSNQTMSTVFNIMPKSGIFTNADSSIIAFSPSVTTSYTVTYYGDCGFTSDTVSFTVNVIPVPKADFNFNPTNPTTEDGTIYLLNNSIDAISYEWRNDMGSLLSQDEDYGLANPGKDIHCYTLTAFNPLHCKDTIRKCVSIKEIIPGKVFIPNVFSPNGDGLNDEFKIYAINIDLENFIIYNRYGERIFYTADINQGWDGNFKGKPCDVGTYFYQVIYTDYKGIKETLKNDIELIR